MWIPDHQPVDYNRDVQDARILHLERLRQWRGSRERDVTIGQLVKRIARDSRHAERKLDGLEDFWFTNVPNAVATRTRITGISNGIASVVAESSSVRYQLHRILKSGLERKLKDASSGRIRSIRVSI